MQSSKTTLFAAVFAGALVLTGCGDKKPKPAELPALGATIPNLIMPANAAFVSQSGSEDALSLVLRTPGQPEAVVGFYRNYLNPPLWRLVSDTRDSSGAYLLYAEQDGPPLWIRVWPDSEFNGTLIRLTGAVQALSMDSTTAAGRAAIARRDSLKLLPRPKPSSREIDSQKAPIR